MKLPLLLRKSFWVGLAPGPHAWRGAAWGLAAATCLAWLVVCYDLRWSLSNPAALLVQVLLPVAAILAGGVLAALLGWLGRLPWFYRWTLAAGPCLLYVSFGGSVRSGLAGAITVTVGATLAGAGLVSLVCADSRTTTAQRRIAASGVMSGPAILLAGVVWLVWDGPSAKPLPNAATLAQNRTPPFDDPSRPGPHPVRTLTYGSGTDRHRPEYGPQSALKTKPVDGSRLIDRWKGRPGWARTRYWGFDARQLPIQGRGAT